MPVKCDICGQESEFEESYFKEPKSFSRKTRLVCPVCREKRQVKGHLNSLYLNLGIGVLAWVMTRIWPMDSLGWIWLNLFLCEVFFLLVVIPHELGHAFVGRFNGFEIFRVVIGVGKTVWRGYLCGFDTEIKSVPAGGITTAATPDDHHYRRRHMALVVAGPMVNLLLAALVFTWSSWDEVANVKSWSRSASPTAMFFWANVLLLVTNLVPHTVQTVVGAVGNDGKQIWETLFLKPEKLKERLMVYYLLQAISAYERNDHIESLHWVELGRAKFPENMHLLSYEGLLLMERGECQRGREIFEEIMRRGDCEPVTRYLMLNNIAYANAVLDERQEEADRYSKEALAGLGWVPCIKGTRGSVLLNQGQTEEGLRLVKEAMEGNSVKGKAQNACWMAMGEFQRNKHDEAQRLLRMAVEMDADCCMLKRARAYCNSPAAAPGPISSARV